jgi:hypothetical protein
MTHLWQSPHFHSPILPFLFSSMHRHSHKDWMSSSHIGYLTYPLHIPVTSVFVDYNFFFLFFFLRLLGNHFSCI